MSNQPSRGIMTESEYKERAHKYRTDVRDPAKPCDRLAYDEANNIIYTIVPDKPVAPEPRINEYTKMPRVRINFLKILKLGKKEKKEERYVRNI